MFAPGPGPIGRSIAVCLLTMVAAAFAAPARKQDPGGGFGAGRQDPGSPLFAEGEVLVKFRPRLAGHEAALERARFGAVPRHRFRSGAEHWTLGPGVTTAAALEALAQDPDVEYAEPNYVLSVDLLPNDPRFPELYGLRNTGQTGGVAGADIDATAAWDNSTGSPDVIVAVIDTGIDRRHPDLAGNFFVNTGEISGNRLDDDGNGYIDDARGWDFINRDNDPFDDNRHGTHVAGTIAAVGNNGVGVAGVAWRVRLLPLKILGATGSGLTSDAILAVEYAALMGADVINASWGGGGFSQALREAIEAAGAQQVVFVASAGNSARDIDRIPAYPAAYDAENIIAVAATDARDRLAIFSNHGVARVDLAAPGVAILSTVPGGGYQRLNGTSMAAPHVTGAVALLRSIAPDVRVTTIKKVLLRQVTPVPWLEGVVRSGGRLHLTTVLDRDGVPPGAARQLAVSRTGSNFVTLSWLAPGDDADAGVATTYEIRSAAAPIVDAAAFAAARPIPCDLAPAAAGTVESFEVGELSSESTSWFAVRAVDDWDNHGPIGDTVPGTTLPPPAFGSAPDSLQGAARAGESVLRTLTISNAGVGTLDWTIPVPPVGPFLRGPDAFGYRATTSDLVSDPAFAWRDIAAFGADTGLQGFTGHTGPIPLGFAFPYYEGTFHHVRINADGWVSFTRLFGTSDPSEPFPTFAAPENMIAPFWRFMTVTNGGRVLTHSDGASFTIQWDRVENVASGEGPFTFQLVLESGGRILFKYLSLGRRTRDPTSIGIQDQTKTRGLRIDFGNTIVHDGQAVAIDRLPQWLSAAPTAGRLGAGESGEVQVRFDARGLRAGSYDGAIEVRSNDPRRGSVLHPARLMVTDAAAIDIEPGAVDFGSVVAGGTGGRTLLVRNIATLPLSITGLRADDPDIAVDFAPFVLEARQTRTIPLTWSPAAPRLLRARLTVEHDAHGGVHEIGVTGAAVASPRLRLVPGRFDERLVRSETVTRGLTLANDSDTDLDVTFGLQHDPASEPVFQQLGGEAPYLTCVVADPSTGTLYGQLTGTWVFLKYEISEALWRRLADAPMPAVNLGGAALLNGRIYTAYQQDSTQLGVYDIATDRWWTLPHPLGMQATAIASDGIRWIYLALGHAIVRLDPDSTRVERFDVPLMRLERDGDLHYLDGALYGHSSGPLAGFSRYHIASGIAETLPAVPEVTTKGSTIDLGRREYLLFDAQGGTGLYRYAIDTRTWRRITLPEAHRASAQVVWIGGPIPGVYYLPGIAPTPFLYRYGTRPLWAAVDEAGVRVPARGEAVVPVRIQTGAIAPGSYRAEILVASNDPDRRTERLPIALEVVLDADRDGVVDAEDNCIAVANAGQENDDSDRFGNACDLCPTVSEEAQSDVDGDRFGDACDPCVLDAGNDADADGWCAEVDDCPSRPNPGQEDADGDGVGDVCDNCARSNPDQADQDGDGMADACDSCPASADPDRPDRDGDGVGDVCDRCPDVADPGQADTDRDGAGDACQPAARFDAIDTSDGQIIRVRGRAVDPQNDPLHGALELYASSGEMLDLADSLLSADCATGWSPDGAPGRGIGFTHAAIGAPHLFDLDSVLLCDDGQSDFGIAFGSCASPIGLFEASRSLEGVPLPSVLCVRRTSDDSGGIELTVRSADPDRLRAATGTETRVARLPFEGELPRQIDLSGLPPRQWHRLVLEASDGSTPPARSEETYFREAQSLLIVNNAPLAAMRAPAGECDGPGGGIVLLDGRDSIDPDTRADIVRYEWLEDPEGPAPRSLGAGPLLAVRLALGTHRVGLRVEDRFGETSRAAADVVVADRTPPAFALRAEPATLWPPNHRMVPIRLSWDASDLCGGPPSVVLVDVASSEPDDAPGAIDGATTSDIAAAEPGTAGTVLALRAERDAAGPGRTYVIRYRAIDAAGNESAGLAVVTVPHDLGQEPPSSH